MRRTFQIREWKTIERFQSHLSNDAGAAQMVLPLAQIAQLLRQEVSQLFGPQDARTDPP